MIAFLHTADWHIGKPFARIEDPTRRVLLQRERLEAVRRLGDIARREEAAFVVVAGDIFDSPTICKDTIVAALSVIGSVDRPVYAIPGNHDHAGPGSVWGHSFFTEQAAKLAPNLTVLLKAEPVILPTAVLLPCPMLRRHESTDPTSWLRDAAILDALPKDLPRILLAHGSTQTFAGTDEEDDTAAGVNLLDLERLTGVSPALDYVALGDWHGTKDVTPPAWCGNGQVQAWFSGTPATAGFPKGEANDPGNVLLIRMQGRSQACSVARIPIKAAHLTAGAVCASRFAFVLVKFMRPLLTTRCATRLIQEQFTHRLQPKSHIRAHTYIGA